MPYVLRRGYRDQPEYRDAYFRHMMLIIACRMDSGSGIRSKQETRSQLNHESCAHQDGIQSDSGGYGLP